MTRSVISLLLLLLLHFSSIVGLLAQEEGNYQMDNHTYVDNILTVRFHVAGFPHTYPIDLILDWGGPGA
ncbi:MAG: hypothetical protein HC821_03855, partial [Lewinella sp.]|nr:hypothetical protein [Lewinella sp.]